MTKNVLARDEYLRQCMPPPICEPHRGIFIPHVGCRVLKVPTALEFRRKSSADLEIGTG